MDDASVAANAYPRIQFKTNVDDLVDATLRYWKRRDSDAWFRRRGPASVALWFTGAIWVFSMLFSDRPSEVVLSRLGVALVVGALCWPLYAPTYERGVIRWLRTGYLREMGTTPWRCEIELRSDGAWTRSRSFEVLYVWDSLQEVVEAPDAVELHFDDGFIVARARAFASDAERQEFARVARELARV